MLAGASVRSDSPGPTDMPETRKRAASLSSSSPTRRSLRKLLSDDPSQPVARPSSPATVAASSSGEGGNAGPFDKWRQTKAGARTIGKTSSQSQSLSPSLPSLTVPAVAVISQDAQFSTSPRASPRLEALSSADIPILSRAAAGTSLSLSLHMEGDDHLSSIELPIDPFKLRPDTVIPSPTHVPQRVFAAMESEASAPSPVPAAADYAQRIRVTYNNGLPHSSSMQAMAYSKKLDGSRIRYARPASFSTEYPMPPLQHSSPHTPTSPIETELPHEADSVTNFLHDDL